MAFFKTKVDLSTLTSKIVAKKKSIVTLGNTFDSPSKMAAIFIALDKASDNIGSADLTNVIIFGKIKQMKGELKKLIGANKPLSGYGLVYVEKDEKKIPTLVISPVIGDGFKKETLLKKAMKQLFGNTYSRFRIAAPTDEKAAEAMEAATENLEIIEASDADILPETIEAVESAKDLIDKAQEKVDATAKPGADAAKTDAQVNTMTKVIAHVTGLMDTLKKLQAEKAEEAKVLAAAQAVEKALVGAQTGKIV